MQEMKPMNYQENYEGLLPKGAFRISPSMVSKFNDRKHEWFRSQILGEVTFKGNTATHLGTCIHRIAESFIKTKDVNKEEIYEYIDAIDDIEVDKEFIKSQLQPMGQVLIDSLINFGIPDKAEEKVAYNLLEDVWVAGTYDALLGDTLIDFKTTSMKSPSEKIPQAYKWQLLTYAYALRKTGVEVNRVRIIWVTVDDTGRVSEKTGKPLKDYPSKCTQVTEVITEEDMRFIEDYLKLIAETYVYYKNFPDLAYILYSDYRLKDESNISRDTPFNTNSPRVQWEQCNS